MVEGNLSRAGHMSTRLKPHELPPPRPSCGESLDGEGMTIKIGLAGDTMPGRGVAAEIATAGPRSLFSSEVRDWFESADLGLLNLECCGASGMPILIGWADGW